MKGALKAIVVAVAVLALAGVAFWAGTAYQAGQDPALGFARGGTLAADGTMPGGGGPMMNLTDEERAALQPEPGRGAEAGHERRGVAPSTVRWTTSIGVEEFP